MEAKSNTVTQYHLPEILQNWPWTRRLSPHYEQCKSESLAWLKSHSPFPPEEQERYDACDTSLLVCMTYIGDKGTSTSILDLCILNVPKTFYAACDLLNFYYVYDEYTDVANLEGVEIIAKLAVDAFERPEVDRAEEDIVGRIAQEMWKRCLSLTAPNATCIPRFVDDVTAYIYSIVQDAQDRIENRIRTFDDYMTLRRNTSGIRPTFRFIEFPLNLPEDVISHPTVVALRDIASDLVALVNDLHSYRMERARGLHSHNVITILINEKDFDIQTAFDWLGNHINQLEAAFLSTLGQLPTWGENIDERVQLYIDQLGQWVGGNDTWSREAKRYYEDSEPITPEEARTPDIITVPSQDHGYAKEEHVDNMIRKLTEINNGEQFLDK